ncbi:MAG: AI-2E family transporter, partial [Gemmataceae bacterium]
MQPIDKASSNPLPGRDPGTVALVVLAVLAVGGVVTYLGPILRPFLIAVFLYFTIRGAAKAVIRLGLRPWLAYVSLLAAAVGLTVTLTLFAYGQGLALRDEWPRYQQRLLTLAEAVPGKAEHSLTELIKGSSAELYAFVFTRGLGVTEFLVMTSFYLLFLFLGAEKLEGRVRRAVAANQADRIVTIAGRISSGIEQFMKVKTLVGLGMGASAAGIMALFGLDHWPLWAIGFFALNYITYIGSILACVPPALLAFLDLDSPVAATVLAALIVLNRVVWVDYVETRLAGKHLNIDSVLLFLWLAYWGWAWGVLGLILAFPMLTAVKIVLEHIEGTHG